VRSCGSLRNLSRGKPGSRFPAQGDLRAINAIYSRVATGRCKTDLNPVSGQKSQDHQMARFFFGQVDAIENRFVSDAKFGE
jgi:hypothetical protein